MNYRKSFTLSLLSGCLIVSGLAVRAETTETTTTQTTTTTTDLALVNLSVNGSYQVVDPITGRVLGPYDPTVRLVEGRPLTSGVVIVDKSNGGLVATVDSNGNIVDISRAPATQTLIVSIDSRRQDLNRRIEEALNRGTLDAKQASAMRAELERIAADEESARQSTGALSYRNALVIGYGLNTLSERLVPVMQTTSFEPVISTQFVTVDGRLVMVDDITSREQRLQRRIDDEYAAGRLSAQQVSRRKEDLNKICSLETQYRRNGVLSNSKDKKLSEKLDRLQTSIDENVSSINQKRSKIGIRAD